MTDDQTRFVLVPVEPTPEMVNAGNKVTWPLPCQQVYRTMLGARPPAPAAPAAPMLNGLTEAETGASASVAGLTQQPAAQALKPVAAVEAWPNDRQPLAIVPLLDWSHLPEGTKLYTRPAEPVARVPLSDDEMRKATADERERCAQQLERLGHHELAHCLRTYPGFPENSGPNVEVHQQDQALPK